MLYMFVVLSFIIGFFIGALCYSLGFLKIFPNHKVMDELTRTKRELASAKRILDEFFKTSGHLFSELDKSYRDYAKFMNDAASKLSSSDGSLFIPQDELEVEDNLKKMLSNKHLEDFNAESETVAEHEKEAKHKDSEEKQTHEQEEAQAEADTKDPEQETQDSERKI